MSDEYSFATPNKISELEISEGFSIEFTRKMPNLWWRFWQFVLFGFKWRSLEGKE